jgi:PiT family inorganic phosphate transporter
VSPLETPLTTRSLVLLVVCLLVAFGFEFANGFHDTANAVATVIYTNSLRPRIAVVLSGLFNFSGVLVSNIVSGVAVAMGIIKLLPVELLVQSGTGAGLAMVLALLVGAIAWNVGTWYLGLPASSSHTMIGAILGVGLANSLLVGHHFGDGVNLGKAAEIGMSLLISPLFGFAAAFGLLWLVRRYANDPALNRAPEGNAPPPRGTRALLVFTSCAVSFAHGQNDGQKGIGLVMLILMGLVPARYALNARSTSLERTVDATTQIEAILVTHADVAGAEQVADVRSQLADIRKRLGARRRVAEVPREDRFPLRQDILLADTGIDRLVKDGHLGLDDEQRAVLDRERKSVRALTDYAPWWVMIAIAVSLGLGDDDWVETDCCDRRRTNREEPPHLRAGRECRARRGEHHPARVELRSPCQHDPRPVFWRRWHDGRAEERPQSLDRSEHRARLAAHPPHFDASRRTPLFALSPAPRLSLMPRSTRDHSPIVPAPDVSMPLMCSPLPRPPSPSRR